MDPLGNEAIALKEESEFYKAVRDQYTNKNIDVKTELSETDIINLSRIAVLDAWSDGKVPALRLFTKSFKTLRVSKERKGRTEFFETFKPVGFQQMQEGNFMQRMFTPQNKP
jgi:hypothetical protein